MSRRRQSTDLKILVTGGAGFIGSHLVEELLRKSKQHEITIFDDFSAGREQNISNLVKEGAVNLVKSDIRNIEVVEDVCKGMDLVFHLAAKTNIDESLRYPLVFDDVNCRGTLHLLKGALENNSKFVHMSTSEVYGTTLFSPMDESHPLNPQSPYAASKVGAEKYVYSFHLSYKLPTVIIRSFNNYGPRQKGNIQYGGLVASNIIRALTGNPLIIRGGSQTRDYLYVKDTVKALVTAGLDEKAVGETINIGTQTEFTARKIVSLINELSGADVPIKEEAVRPGDVERLICNYQKAKKFLGWSPKFSFEEGLKESIQWYRDHLDEVTSYLFPSFSHSTGQRMTSSKSK